MKVGFIKFLLLCCASFAIATSSFDNALLIEQLKKDKTLQAKLKNNATKQPLPQQKNIQTEESNQTSLQTTLNVIENANSTTLGKNQSDLTVDTSKLTPLNYYKNFTPLFYEDQLALAENLEKNQISLGMQKLERFGIDFFKPTNQVIVTSGVPDDYILSQGDTLKIAVYGIDEYDGELEINKDGKIVIPAVGAIAVRGMTYEKAKKIIYSKLATTMPNSTIIITIGNLSPFSVGVVGEVKKPGLYTLNALSKVKDALVASGGISENGTLREIQVKRNGKTIATFDLYELIRGGKDNGDIFLRPGDIIYVPNARNLVWLSGNVKSPAIYELKKNETLQELMSLAGGANSDATMTAKISRSFNGKRELLEVKLTDTFVLQDGDKIVAGKISDVIDNEVSLYGNIYNKGNISLLKNDTVGTLFKRLFDFYGKEKILMPDTDMQYYMIKRVDKQNLKNLIISANLNAALQHDKTNDIQLQSGDKIFIFNKSMTSDIKYITINGEVLRKGKFKHYDGMKLIDALMIAGTKKESDLKKIKVISLNTDATFNIKYYSIEDAYTTTLQPYDDITITNFVANSDLPTVKISGAVLNSGSYQYADGLSINDLIALSGGLKQNANMDQFELLRYRVENGSRKHSLELIDLQKAIESRFTLKPFDEVTIRQISGWDDNKTVILKGEVKFPGSYTILPGERLSSLIKRAGGFTDNAFVDGTVFSRIDIKKLQEEAFKKQLDDLESMMMYLSTQPQGAGESNPNTAEMMQVLDSIRKRAKQTQLVGRLSLQLDTNLTKFSNSAHDIILKAGDVIAIPEIEQSVAIIGEVMNPTAVTYQNDELTLFDYIDKAGGLKSTASADDIYVIKANGEAKKVKKHFLFGYTNVDINPGDTIVVPFKMDRFSGMKFAKDITGILYQIAISAAAMKTLGAL